MISARDLKMHEQAIYLNDNSAWSEFHWDFHATLRNDGSAVTTHGVETQVYRKEDGQWRLVRVHYSADRHYSRPATSHRFSLWLLYQLEALLNRTMWVT